MKLNRKRVTVLRSVRNDTVDEEGERQEQALSFVWELTEEIYSLSGRYDVKSRLQRNVISITRQQS